MNNVLMIMNARNLSAFKECVNKLKLKSNSEWRILVKENNIPNNIPTSPQTFYKNKSERH